MARTDDTPPVVVGYDGSKAAQRALRWAVDEARRRWTSLVICHAWHWPYPARPSDPAILETFEVLARGVLDQGVRIATGLAPTLPVHPRLIAGGPSAALVSESHTARLVVVGNRGLGGFTDLHLGSAAVQVPAYSACPVVVVGRPEPGARTTSGLVVVGVDGSPAGEAAMGFAAEEAAIRDGRLHAVFCWWPPEAEVEAMEAAGPLDADAEALRRRAVTRFHETVAVWSEKYPDLRVETSVLDRPPRQALREAAEHAELLVVGSRGLVETHGLPLGPVTQSMLHHAPCPVAVVPEPLAHRPASR